MNDSFVYLIILLVSVLFLFVGNFIASNDADETDMMDNAIFYSGVVVEIVDRIVSEPDWHQGESIDIFFDVRITGGERRGDIVTAEQQVSDFFLVNEREVSVGDRVLLFYCMWTNMYFFSNFNRINYIAVLGVVLLVLVILFGKKKGFNAIVALGFTCLAVFWVFIPAILSGHNIYITTIIICAYAIISTLLIVIGVNKKALSAMLGCLGGVFSAAVLMAAMDGVLRLTGALDRETESLLFLPTESPINLRAIIFAGVILGAVGAIMDVAMSIASSLWEIKETGGVSDFRSIFKSGINIGKDILGTMLNTLILAYIGSSLSLILLLTAHTADIMNLFNMEMIIVEFLRALIGAFGMLLTIPLTAGICGWLYGAGGDFGDGGDDEEYQKRIRERRMRYDGGLRG